MRFLKIYDFSKEAGDTMDRCFVILQFELQMIGTTDDLVFMVFLILLCIIYSIRWLVLSSFLKYIISRKYHCY